MLPNCRGHPLLKRRLVNRDVIVPIGFRRPIENLRQN